MFVMADPTTENCLLSSKIRYRSNKPILSTSTHILTPSPRHHASLSTLVLLYLRHSCHHLILSVSIYVFPFLLFYDSNSRTGMWWRWWKAMTASFISVYRRQLSSTVDGREAFVISLILLWDPPSLDSRIPLFVSVSLGVVVIIIIIIEDETSLKLTADSTATTTQPSSSISFCVGILIFWGSHHQHSCHNTATDANTNIATRPQEKQKPPPFRRTATSPNLATARWSSS